MDLKVLADQSKRKGLVEEVELGRVIVDLQDALETVAINQIEEEKIVDREGDAIAQVKILILQDQEKDLPEIQGLRKREFQSPAVLQQ